MTPQEHIQSIGDALKKTEAAHAELGKVIRQLHKSLDRAQRAYSQEHGNDDNVIVLYSTTDGDAPGGTSKPDPNEPDPVEP